MNYSDQKMATPHHDWMLNAIEMFKAGHKEARTPTKQARPEEYDDIKFMYLT